MVRTDRGIVCVNCADRLELSHGPVEKNRTAELDKLLAEMDSEQTQNKFFDDVSDDALIAELTSRGYQVIRNNHE